MTDTDRNRADDERSDLEQAVDARDDALARGEGGTSAEGQGGESGADGVVKNQEDLAQ